MIATASAIPVFLASVPPGAMESAESAPWPADLERLSRLRDGLRRRQFIAGRALLRVALARCFGPAAAAWRLVVRGGRPELHGIGAPCVSLSHSAELVACALATHPVGLDIERCVERDFPAMAEYICSPGEWHAFRSLPNAARKQAFYRLWTAKEAVFKLIGREPFPDLGSGADWHAADPCAGFAAQAQAGALRGGWFCPHPRYAGALATLGHPSPAPSLRVIDLSMACR